jgi:hypothetical protein
MPAKRWLAVDTRIGVAFESGLVDRGVADWTSFGVLRRSRANPWKRRMHNLNGGNIHIYLCSHLLQASSATPRTVSAA